MKKLLAIIAIAALAIGAQAQQRKYGAESVSVPTTLTGATNLASPRLLDVTGQKDVTIQATLGAASIQTNTYTFCVSVDGSNIDTNSAKSFLVVSTGASRVSTTNFTVNGAGYLVLTRIAPTDTTIATTNTLKYGVKLGAP